MEIQGERTRQIEAWKAARDRLSNRPKPSVPIPAPLIIVCEPLEAPKPPTFHLEYDKAAVSVAVIYVLRPSEYYSYGWCRKVGGPAFSSKEITRAIIRTVTADFCVTQKDLLSHRRAASICLPRHIAVLLCYELTRWGHTQVAQFFGRDHTTTAASVIKARALCDKDPELAARVGRLMAQVKFEIGMG